MTSKSEHGAAIEIRGFWKFLKFIVLPALLLSFITWVTTRFFSLDLIIINWLILVHISNIWLLFPETITVAGSAYIIYLGWQSEKKKKLQRRTRDLQELAREVRTQK